MTSKEELNRFIQDRFPDGVPVPETPLMRGLYKANRGIALRFVGVGILIGLGLALAAWWVLR